MKQTQKKPKKRSSSLLPFLIAVPIISVVFLFITENKADANFSYPDTVSVISESSTWWNDKYAYRRRIVLDSLDRTVLNLNHSQLVVEGKSNSDGSDLKIVGQSKEGFKEVYATVSSPDSVSASVVIKDNIDLKGYEYYLYYGNKVVANPTEIIDEGEIDDSNYVIVGEEEAPIVQLKNLRKWVLKENASILPLSVATTQDLKDYSITLVSKDFKKKSASIQNNLLNIEISELEPGEQSFFVVLKKEGSAIRSNTVTFLVSEPIYIAWTVDWEGVDPGKANMEALGNMARDYKIPLTHFYNPRLYINVKVTDFREKEITTWLKNRLADGDDMAMHLHMQFDMVEEAGINAKYDDVTWDNGLSGYDMPSTVYSYEEYLKILQWGKNKLVEMGLPEPKGYRAGGWFANMNNMKAIKDAGFTYDSTSRVPVAMGENNMAQDWRISNTTQPYKISENDLSSETEPTMNLLEVPNNGGDSFWLETETLKESFAANYDAGTIVGEKKLITFTTSPDWFPIDEPKLNDLWTEIRDYRNDIDKGPVKFVTIKEYLEATK